MLLGTLDVRTDLPKIVLEDDWVEDIHGVKELGKDVVDIGVCVTHVTELLCNRIGERQNLCSLR